MSNIVNKIRKANILLIVGCIISCMLFNISIVHAASASINKKSVVLKVGGEIRLKVKARNVSRISWSSTDDLIAFVSSNGYVYGKSAGKATITAKVYFKNGKSVSKKCKVTVKSGRYVKAVPYQQGYAGDIYNGDNSFSMMGIKYYNGFASFSNGGNWAQYNLNGDYETLTYKVGHVDNSGNTDGVITIELDGEIADEYTVTSNMVTQEKTLDVSGAVSMKIILRESANTEYGIADPVLDKGHD